MELDRLRLRARLRTPWQAIDLGWVLARRWWLPLWLSWSIPYGTVLALGLALLPQRLWWLAALLPWWFKPVFDSFPLYLLSRRLFGEVVPVRTAWREALRHLGREGVPWLSWRRLSPTRSMDLPLSVLEGLRGGARAARLQLLHRRSANAAGWLTAACANLELIVGIGLVSLIYWLLPNDSQPALRDWFGDHDAVLRVLNYAIFAFGATAVAPFYIAAGFSIYLNRRIELEGWDIEIRFRHIASARHRLQPAAAALAALVLAGAAALAPPPAYAAAAATQPAAAVATGVDDRRQTAQRRIRQVLDGADFRSHRVERHWRWKHHKATAGPSPVPQWMIRLAEFLERLGVPGRGVIGVVDVLRWLLGATLVGFIAYLLYRYRDALHAWLQLPPRTPAAAAAVPEMLFGLDVRAGRLPDDVIAEVTALQRRGELRQALSLLYRASLTRLLHGHALAFRDDMTEGECLRVAEGAVRPEIAGLFRDLTCAWQRQAYAHIPTDAVALGELCSRWRAAFGTGQEAAHAQ